ncbi:MAG: hypothetical protein AzoDbin1_04074 [Azoarcus sp.]|nr:hypothetical protein [Azoarcus sp.]
MRVLIAALLSIALAGCARLSTLTPLPSAAPTPPDRLLAFQAPSKEASSSLVIIRDSGIFGGVCYAGIWLNGTLAARIASSETATFYLPSGEHILTIGNVGTGNSACDIHQDRTRREISLKEGQRKLYRALWNKSDGIHDLQPYIAE